MMHVEQKQKSRGRARLIDLDRGVAAVSLLLVFSAASAVYNLVDLRDAGGASAHAHDVLRHLVAAETSLVDAESERRGFALSNSPKLAEGFDRSRSRTWLELSRARALTADDPEQQRALDALDQSVGARVRGLARLVDAQRTTGVVPAVTPSEIAATETLREVTQRGFAAMKAVEGANIERADERSATKGRRSFVIRALASLFGLALVFLGRRRIKSALRTSRAATEERQRFFELTSDLVCSLDANGVIIDANRALVSAAKDDAPIAGRRLEDVLPGELAVVAAESAAKAIASPGETIRYEVSAERKEGGKRWLDCRVVHDAVVRQTFFGAIDVTHRHAADEMLRELAMGLERNNAALSLSSKLMGMLSTCEDISEVRPILSSFLGRLFEGTKGAMFVLRASHNLLESVGAWGSFEEASYGPGECWAMRRGRTHVASGEDGPACGHVHDLAPGHSTICMPMMARGEAIGVLVIEQSGQINADDMLLVRVCEDLALAISSLRLRASLRSMSVRDPLTGLFNRRYLDETMERELRRAERSGQPLSLIIADVDRFKTLNDTFGHEAGDEALQAFGAALLRSARTEDVVCRYGGEEFVVLLPNTTPEAARERAELIRAKVRALDLRHKGRPLGVLTASFGVASMPENGSTSAAIVRTADAALYQAKAAGRDRVELAPPRKQSGYDMRAVTLAS